jgi:hypothetical protein
MTSLDNHLPSDPPPRLNNFDVEERSHSAQALLASKEFRDAMQEVYSRAAGTLLEAEVGSLTANSAHAMMKAVLDIRSQLEQYINDHKMRAKYNKGDP